MASGDKQQGHIRQIQEMLKWQRKRSFYQDAHYLWGALTLVFAFIGIMAFAKVKVFDADARLNLDQSLQNLGIVTAASFIVSVAVALLVKYVYYRVRIRQIEHVLTRMKATDEGRAALNELRTFLEVYIKWAELLQGDEQFNTFFELQTLAGYDASVKGGIPARVST